MPYARRADRVTLTVSEAARKLGVSENTVRRLCDEGAIASARTPAGYRVIDPVALESYAQGQPTCAA